MVHTKYKFIPDDIAIYAIVDDLSHKKLNYVLESIFKTFNNEIVHPYRNNYVKFRKKVFDLIIKYNTNISIIDEAELIMKELGGSCFENIGDIDCFGSYFKLIKLQLLYSKISYKKIKLRTLMKKFNYNRRSDKLIENINRSIKALGLAIYLKKRQKCELDNIKIDDMLIIRIKNT